MGDYETYPRILQDYKIKLHDMDTSKQIFICSESTTETLEKGVIYDQR